MVDISRLKPGHPRLFADAARFEQLRTQNDDVSRDLRQIILAAAERDLGKPDVEYPPAGSNTEYPGPGGKFGAMREVQARILALGLAYRLTGDRRFFQKARHDLIQLAAVPDWNPKHYITLGEGAFAAAVGYDWLYNDLTPADRDAVANAIKVKALEQSLEARPDVSHGYEVNRSWLDGVLNWNPVVNGSLAVAALAIADREPVLAKTILDRSIHYIQYAGSGYEPDGAWPEAPNYWAFGTSYYVVAIDALRSALGSDYGVAAHPGFLKTGEFNLQMFAPTGRFYGFSDYSEEYQNEPQMLWLARETRRPDLIRTELDDVARLAGRPTPDRMPGKEMRGNKHTPLELIWWQPALLTGVATAPPLPLHWTAQGPMPIAVMRTAWGDPRATYVALKGGTPTDSHSHMDAGSFILEAGGVRWALDLGSEGYDNMRRVKLDLWNMTQDSPRWSTFRVGPDGHNILRFDDARQIVSGRGLLTALPRPATGNRIDLTSYYAPYTQNVERTIRLVPGVPGGVDIQDRWRLRERSAKVTFQWLTRAKVSRTTTGLRLEQDGKLLDVTVDGPTDDIRIEDVSAPRAPQDSPNPGVSRILISRQTFAGGEGSFHVSTRLAIP